jgi:energy-coupling factor transporter ATP-binding protein EcfA2
MEENGTATAAETVETSAVAPEMPVEAPVVEEEVAAEPEEISYHAVEKEGHVAAIWEMQGRRHLRTIDPRSSEGKQIMDLYTADSHE